MATKKKTAKPATKKTATKTDTKDAWTPALRKRLSASRRAAELEPKGFFLDPDAAFAALGGSGPAPATLSADDEDDRAMRFRFISWKQASGRIFTDEAWNPLVALWSARAGWDFVFDRLLALPALFQADPAAPWCGVRRYLHAANDEAFAQALKRIRPVFDKLLDIDPDKEDAWEKMRQRDYLAFAFDRAGFADQILQSYVDGKLKNLGDIAPLLSATTNAALAQAAADKYGGVGMQVYYVFDLVESQGAKAISLLKRQKPFGAPERKRVEAAIEVAQSL